MNEHIEFMSAEAICASAEESHEAGVGAAIALPLPSGSGQEIEITLLYYQEALDPTRELLLPPHFLVTVDPRAGKVLQGRACVPLDFGVEDEPEEPIEGFGLDPEMSAEVFWILRDRFYELSSPVWALYASGSTRLTLDEVAMIREYHSIFHNIAKAPLIPYYEAVAADFFEWMGEVLS
jgi:hypothetical protein